MQQNPMPMISLVPSKRSYKKLGTILEHITESIDPRYYQVIVNVNSHIPFMVTIFIGTIPTFNAPQSVIVSSIPWVDGCNGQLYINPAVLHENAEW